MPEKELEVPFALVLLSGGLDSTACIQYYIKLGFQVHAVFIDYGQLARKNEFKSARSIASHFGIPFKCCKFECERHFLDGEIKGRNAFLLLSALLEYPNINGLISMGIHFGTQYYDCTESFVREMNKILEGYFDGRVIFEAPFIKWSKKMIKDYFNKNNLPIYLTYSCEKGTDEPCGKCLSCLDRGALNAC
jgi:7-cyano-7-deazaguanine synthase